MQCDTAPSQQLKFTADPKVSNTELRLRAVSHCAESNFSNFEFEYLRETEVLSKTILAYLSGAQMGLIHEIKIWQKIS